MKKYFLNVSSSSFSTNLALLLLRITFGFGILYGHGWYKITHFNDLAGNFYDPLGIGHTASLSAAVFAEVICAALLGVGLLTRIALIPLIFTMLIAAFVIHGADPFSTKEMALLYLTAYIGLFLTGPGKFSLDHKLR